MQSKAVTIFEVPMLNNVDSLACLHVVYRTCIGRQKKKKEEGTGKKREREERKKKKHRLVMQNSQMRGRVPIIQLFSYRTNRCYSWYVAQCLNS